MWEQYKDSVLIAILYDDDFDGKVDRRDEIPGAPQGRDADRPGSDRDRHDRQPAAAPTAAPEPTHRHRAEEVTVGAASTSPGATS